MQLLIDYVVYGTIHKLAPRVSRIDPSLRYTSNDYKIVHPIVPLFEEGREMNKKIGLFYNPIFVSQVTVSFP